MFGTFQYNKMILINVFNIYWQELKLHPWSGLRVRPFQTGSITVHLSDVRYICITLNMATLVSMVSVNYGIISYI